LGPFYDGYYPYRRIEIREYEVGVISIEFLDALTKKPVWRATATGIIDPDQTPGPEEQEHMIEKLVAKILGKFPPL
jgi:hypothetical protein